MSITKEKAIEIGKKVLTDINYSSADLKKTSARLEEGENLKYTSKSSAFWLVSFSYGAEDFGPNVAHVHIDIDAETGEVTPSLINRSGSIKIRFDEKHNKYVRVK